MIYEKKSVWLRTTDWFRPSTLFRVSFNHKAKQELCLKNKNFSLFQAYVLEPIYVFSINIILGLREKIAWEKGVFLCCFTGKEARGIRSCWEVWWMPARKCFGKRKKLPETCGCGPCKQTCKWWNPMNWDSTCAYCGLRKLLVFRPQRWRTSRRLLRRLKNEKNEKNEKNCENVWRFQKKQYLCSLV